MSGEELIQFLQDNEEYDFDKIEQIFPAYEMALFRGTRPSCQTCADMVH